MAQRVTVARSSAAKPVLAWTSARPVPMKTSFVVSMAFDDRTPQTAIHMNSMKYKPRCAKVHEYYTYGLHVHREFRSRRR